MLPWRLKRDERRRLFEEAAGIGLYRTRREEALRRLETTRRNLDRVLDILAELEPRLKSLERQAARAMEYTQVQADLRVLLLEWYGFHWHRFQRDLTDAIDLGRTQEAKLTELRDSLPDRASKLYRFSGSFERFARQIKLLASSVVSTAREPRVHQRQPGSAG